MTFALENIDNFCSCCRLLRPWTGAAIRRRRSASRRLQEVEVGLPVTQQIVDYVDFTGRTEAMPTIDVRARVSGYLDKVLFREGFDVKEGDMLFLIDPRTYQADYDRAGANLAQATPI